MHYERSSRLLTPLWIAVLLGSLAPTETVRASTTYYVDAVAGQNTQDGASLDTAWRDFTNINGRTLDAGDKLLIKRGSVINQELQISARGTADNWVEIGVYGTGPRPIIHRNWDIADRCVLIRDPDYVRICSLVVTCAAKGLVVTYTQPGHEGLLIEDCIAYHIEGLYRPNSSGIPEWRDRPGPQEDGFEASAGIAVTGAPARDITIRDCEMFHTSWGFFVLGDEITLDRIYCHHCYAHNTSPHPAVVRVRNSVMQNCVLDASGGHAYAGTMGIMLVDPRDFTIRNCTFRNVPDSNSHDEGGIDFENQGDRCLIDACTFENNAGAAIEVLGLSAPQPTNVDIVNSRFIKNNWANKLGPAEIYIWGKSQPQDPKVCCSSGTIRGNGYVLLPGVEFFVNEAPTLTHWTLQDNVQYDTVEALDKVMPHNNPPAVEAGEDLYSDTTTIQLAGVLRDDGRPAPGSLKPRWEVLEGDGPVDFADATSATTRASFGMPGDYLLRLVGDDGELWTSDTVAVHVLPAGTTVAKAWEFNQPLNKEGWIETDLGTRERKETDARWPCTSQPVMYVSGGYYIVAVEESTNAHLTSADQLNVDISAHKTIKVRFQNHTPAQQMRFAFTTAADTTWDEAKSITFDVSPDDNGPREYAIDLSAVPG
ncbi:MAG: right-handed parallel beta-helix repeat-containing protein, partial [Pirellulaceae bacterium]